MIYLIGCAPTTTTTIDIPDFVKEPVYQNLIECGDHCSNDEILLNVEILVRAINECDSRRRALIRIIDKHNEAIK